LTLFRIQTINSIFESKTTQHKNTKHILFETIPDFTLLLKWCENNNLHHILYAKHIQHIFKNRSIHIQKTIIAIICYIFAINLMSGSSGLQNN